MGTDYFDVVDLKVAEAEKHLEGMGKAIIHPRHRPGAPRHYAAVLSSSGTVMYHNWHEDFNAELNAFLSATRSVPDVIQNRFGYDDHGKDKKHWLLSLTQPEQDRRKDFQKKFEGKFKQFRKLPLNNERNEAHHGSGVAHWEVKVKGMWGTYIGGPTNPIPHTESPPTMPGEDPALAVIAACAILPIEPKHIDFWWAIPGSAPLPLFPECRTFLEEGRGLVTYARHLYQTIHDGHPFTLPPW